MTKLRISKPIGGMHAVMMKNGLYSQLLYQPTSSFYISNSINAYAWMYGSSNTISTTYYMTRVIPVHKWYIPERLGEM